MFCVCQLRRDVSRSSSLDFIKHLILYLPYITKHIYRIQSHLMACDVSKFADPFGMGDIICGGYVMKPTNLCALQVNSNQGAICATKAKPILCYKNHNLSTFAKLFAIEKSLSHDFSSWFSIRNNISTHVYILVYIERKQCFG